MNVAVIPARGGSKRIPRKNIRMFHGKPIITYSIEAAKESGLFDQIWVSSDDDEILSTADALGVFPYRRADGYVEDDIGTQEVTAACLRANSPNADYACCVYATAPLMTAEDLIYSHELFTTTKYRYVYVNGWYYWGNAKDFGARPDLQQSLELDRIIGDRWIDINTEDDFLKAERMLLLRAADELKKKYGS